MGIRNKQRRAAKARAKARSSQRPYARESSARGSGAPREHDPSPAELVTYGLQAAAEALLHDQEAEATPYLDGLAAADPAILDGPARRIVEGMVTAIWRAGWLPGDLQQIAQRRRGGAVEAYLVDAIAAEHRQYPAARIHPRWAGQLREIGATVWWEPGRPHLTQWIQRHHSNVADAVRAVAEVMALLRSLHVLPQILPLPGTAKQHSADASRGVDQKVLTRVRALLAKAESTDFPEEAEALSTKAQELMARHALERAVVDAAGGDDPEPVTARRLWLDNPYLDAKSLLVDAVATANRCRTVFSPHFGFITVLGDDVDLEAVEVLSTSLLVQATKAMLAGGSRTSHGRSRTRSYRQSFLVAYATRIGERLSTATEQAVTAEAGHDTRLLPVLAAREQAVDRLFDEMFPDLVQRSVSVSNAEGYHAGRAAADLAVLDTHRSVRA